jgi:di/tricarboxylate transporter
MTWEIGYTLFLLLAGLVLFSREFLPIDVVALILLLLLVLPPGILTPAEAFAGFGSETIVTLIALFVVTAGVTRTGVVERVGMRIASLAREHPSALLRMLLVGVTTVSGFISNTVTTAALLPLAIGTARRARIPLAKVLMPLAFASILSGGVTLISTSTNLVVSGELPRYGLAPIGFFELAPVGIVVTVLGMLYLLFVAPRLIPDRGTSTGEPGPRSLAAGTADAVRRIFTFDWAHRVRGVAQAPEAGSATASTGDGHGAADDRGSAVIERYELRRYFTEVVITSGSSMAGKSLGESRLGEAIDLMVVGLRRGDTRIVKPRPSVVLNEGDVLLVEGRAEDVLAIKDAAGIEIKPDVELTDRDLQSDDVRMVEAMVLPRSELIGGSLRDVRFGQLTGVTVLGIHSPLPDRARSVLSRHRLHPGDMLLLQGTTAQLGSLDSEDLMLLGDKSAHHPRSRKATTATLVFAGAILLSVTRLLPISAAFLIGVPVLILTRCLTTEEAYESVDWRLLVLIGAMMAFGAAMAKTGAAAFLAGLIVTYVSPLGGRAVLIGFFLLTLILTQPMSNQAAALVLLPVAIQVAHGMGLEPRPLVMSVTFAASCSFLTPLEPSCVLVYGPGNYRFLDFVRVGGLLTVIVFVASVLLIPRYWPLVQVVTP